MLWYLDPHHDKFTSRSIHIPEIFLAFRGYNDYKKKKEKEPQLSSESLKHHYDVLSGILMQPWIAQKRYDVIRKNVENLVEALHKYNSYLNSQCEKMKSQQLHFKQIHAEENASLCMLKQGRVLYHLNML